MAATILVCKHASGLDESMDTVQEVFASKSAIADYFNRYGFNVTADEIKVSPYGYDARIGWDTHVVTVSWGCLGYTNGPVS